MRIPLKAQANVTPLPVLMIATYNDDGTPNCMNAAWGCQYDNDEVLIVLGEHRTTDNLKARKAFTLSYATRSTVEESDFFGIVTGSEVDKVAKVGFHAEKSPLVDAPLLLEYPLTLECEVKSLERKEDGTYLLYGKVKGVSADESVLTEGKVDIDKLEPIAFSPFDHSYRLVKEKAAMAFSCGLKFK